METKKNIFEQKWVFWVSLILLPPLAFWLIMCENYDFTEKQTKALKIGAGIWMVLWVLSARSVTSNNYNADVVKSVQDSQTEKHIYDNVQVKNMLTGDKSKVVGQYSICYVDSSMCTEDALTDWYYNYVNKHNYDINYIAYTDIQGKGCSAMSGIIEKDIYLDEDDIGISRSESRSETMYLARDGKLENNGWLSNMQDENEDYLKAIYPTCGTVTKCNVDLENCSIEICIDMDNKISGEFLTSMMLQNIRFELQTLQYYKDCNVYFEITQDGETAIKARYTTDAFNKADNWGRIDKKDIAKYATEWECNATVQNYIK